MIKDFWVCQERQSKFPWALYVVKEYDLRHPSATVLDFTLYCEEIDNPTHSVSKIDCHFPSVGGYVGELASIFDEYDIEYDLADDEQLMRAIERILIEG